jgi:hypothetical protein
LADCIQIHFIQAGSDENPIPPRCWPFVPRIGDSVFIPETRNIYKVTDVRWDASRHPDGTYDVSTPLVYVEIVLDRPWK